MCVEQCDVTFRVNHRLRAVAGGERARRSEADDTALGVDFTEYGARPFTDVSLTYWRTERRRPVRRAAIHSSHSMRSKAATTGMADNDATTALLMPLGSCACQNARNKIQFNGDGALRT